MSKGGEEKDAFYVVRKGDLTGVYKNLSDCQAQAGSSAHCPSVSVYKGYGLSKDAEDHFMSHGLKNASYSIRAADVKDDIFGKLVPCPFQQPPSARGISLHKNYHPAAKRSAQVFELDYDGVVSASTMTYSQGKHFKLDDGNTSQPASSTVGSCTLEFDGASRGNPGLAGAGAVLRAKDGSLVYRLREGVGTATNNVAEYRALILGLRFALEKGFRNIEVSGDSKIVCMQIQGLWKIKNQNMADLCKVAKELRDKFTSFQINHVLREFNSEADAQANLAVSLKEGHVEVDSDSK